jgi:hypothetical protein
LFPAPPLLRCHCVRTSIDRKSGVGGRAEEMNTRSFFAAFCRRSFGSEYGTRALEATSTLPSLFGGVAERLVTAVLFEPRLRL